MLLSIIMPAYNDGTYMNRAIRSVFMQDMQDFELIIINDGSTDRTNAVCKKWMRTHSNIRLLEQENAGPSIARKNALLAATGKYCLFLDADDWFCDATAFRTLTDKMQESGADVLQFLIQKTYWGKPRPVTGEEGCITREQFWAQDCSTLLGGETHRISPYLCDKIYRTDIWKQALSSYDVDRIYIFDYIYLNLLYFSQKEVQKIQYIPQIFYSWRQYCGGIFQCDETLLNDYEVLKPLQLRVIDVQNLSEKFRKQCHVETAYLFGSACNKIIQHQKATPQLIEALYQYPSVRSAITYFTEHPGGLWDVIYDFMDTSPQKIESTVSRINRNKKLRFKGMFIHYLCR